MKIFNALVLVASVAGCAPPPNRYIPPPRVQTSSAISAPSWCDQLLKQAPPPVPIVDLFNRVRGLRLKPKAELETTAVYSERAESALKSLEPWLSKTSGTDHVVVLMEIYGEYNADSQVFSSTRFDYASDSFLDKDLKAYDYLFLPITEQRRNAGGYVGSNAFGVRRNVQSVIAESYGLALVEQRNTSGWVWENRKISASVPLDRAKATGGKFGVLIIGDLVPPGAREGDRHYAATIDDPVEVTRNKHYVTIRSACAGLVTLKDRELVKPLN